MGVALIAVLVVCAVLAGQSAGSTDFARVAPQEMADRVLKHSQEAYDVLGFTRTVRPGVERVGVGPENTLGADYCYDGGTFGLEDKTVDGAYRMSHEWALDKVPASRAVPGLRRLHRRLVDEGWEVTSYHEGGKDGRPGDWSLYVQKDGGDERMSFDWYPDRGYFTGGATAPCAYDPGWDGSGGQAYYPDDAARSVSLPDLAPSAAQ
ncbi:hypothetical protein [Streptomyces sp. NPDC127190]|uniref:hypothetical protein n=1 Tax=unclassified Streptomyces TaxID=2593676 RepID=UPI00363368A5